MKVTEHKNIYQITMLPNIFPINCFVIEQNDSLIVIDMGVKNFTKKVGEIADETGKSVSHLLLTHSHGDHVSGVNFFKTRFPNAKIGISARDQLILDGDFSLKSDEPQSKINGGFSKKKVETDFTFRHGDIIESLTVIDTPGHTPGSVSFLDLETKTIIAGDAFQTQGGLAVSGTLNIKFPFLKMATWDYKQSIESAKTIMSYKPEILCVGHGDMLIDPLEEIATAIETAEKDLKNR